MSDREDFARALAARTLLLGGATGTELLAARPAVAGESAWLERLNRSEPALVHDVHARFLAAGCDALATNSFRAVCGAPPPHGLGDEAAALARDAAKIARAACDAAPAPARFVLGSLGPGSAQPGFEPDFGVAAAALIAGGADALLFETTSHARHVEAALAAVDALPVRVPVLVSFTVERDGKTRGGLAPADMAAVCADRGVALVALNCSFGPDSLDAPLRRLREQWHGPLGAWPNAGLPAAPGAPHPLAPETLASWIAARTRELALRLVGGCCGAGPRHARAIARALSMNG